MEEWALGETPGSQRSRDIFSGALAVEVASAAMPSGSIMPFWMST
jgi:hypothetical protein